MNILLTGTSGQIGWELQRVLSPLGRVVALGHEDLDLADPDAIRARVREVRPEIVVNAAAYTAVDRAESEPALAQAVNAVAPGILAEEAARQSAFLVHYSTDYVFDGAKAEPYLERDATNPLGAYGRTKLAGERAVTQVGGRHLILRTSWIYATRGHNFLRTIRRLIRERDSLNVVDDQWGAPTWARLVAEATGQILVRLAPPRAGARADIPSGIFHLTCSGQTSWHGFARAIATVEAERGSPSRCDIRPIPTTEYPTPAKRPLNCRLDCSALEREFGLALPDWEWGLRAAVDET
jgi:dTDP-4-dehydrorhamnose reductase